MPVCCTPTRVLFANVTQTVIQYTQDMRDRYGIQPKVYVYYFDTVTGEYVLSVLPFTSMRFDGSQITIDHGGAQSGFVVVT